MFGGTVRVVDRAGGFERRKDAVSWGDGSVDGGARADFGCKNAVRWRKSSSGSRC
jgi:hypothetical protein